MLTPIKNLRRNSIDVVPKYIDWSSLDLDDYTVAEVSECSECSVPVVMSGRGEVSHSDEMNGETDCPGYLNSEGPLMNYGYLIEVNNLEEARLLGGLPLCLVELGSEMFLALTGGGMDLGWEICEGYMRLGFLPPVHFADLAKMAGRGTSKLDKWIINGCRASLRARNADTKNLLKRLSEFGKR